MRIFLALLMILAFSFTGTAQQKWNLATIVDYAMTNNINVKLSEVQAKVAAINYRQSRASQYPSASFSTGLALNSGSNQDPTNFNRITQTYFSSSMQLQSSADIFNFYSKRNGIAAYNWELQAAQAAVDKTKNDIALTAANAYLQVLLSRAQENITVVQIKQTQARLTDTRKKVDAGALPELNATQLEAQLALDSVNYLTAKGNTNQAILVLKSYMNIDAAAPFELDEPPIDRIPVEPIADLQPDYVYSLAIKNQPLQRYDEFKLKAAEKNMAAAKGAMYPTLGAYGNLGSGYNSQSTTVTGYNATPYTDTIGHLYGAPVNYPVTATKYSLSPVSHKTTYFNQLSDNFRQSIGINISVPIFNGRSLRSNYERSKLNISTLQLQKQQDDQTLKQNIYQAYNAALVAYQKFTADKKSVDINELNFNYAQKRFDVGILGTYDLITTQNNLLSAKLQYALDQFDYVFKMKVLEFYKGQGLKL